MHKAKKKPEFLRELWEQRSRKEVKVGTAVQHINSLAKKNVVIDSANMVKEVLNEETDQEYKEHQVRKIMRHDLGMRYKKISHVALHTNSPKNLILRQRYAIELVALLNNGKRIINIDESWIGQSDFRRRKWVQKGQSCSEIQLQVNPRISMIVGLDSTGAVYLSLLQSNNNSQTMELFFKNLVKKLDKEDDKWRKKTVILLDNAPYHASKAFYDMSAGLKLPIIFSGPHSYDAAPCELWFAAFKRKDINPRRVPTGKSNFNEVVRLVVERAQQIPLQHRVLFWHHCLQHAYRYMHLQHI